jgi:hypothetical protein
VSVRGAQHLPAEGPALLVANDRPASALSVGAVIALGRELGRPVRFTGAPDLAPFDLGLRRVGAVVEQPGEVAGLLRAGHLTVVWCRSSLRGGARVGSVRPDLVAPAASLELPVVAVAVLGRRWGREVRVEVSQPLRSRHRVGPLAAFDLADDARTRLQSLLDDAAPPRWPWS